MSGFRTLAIAGRLICLLSFANSWAQGGATSPIPFAQHLRQIGVAQVKAEPDQQKDSTTTKAIAASDPVITIKGLCRDQTIPETDANPCKTVVTRGNFEQLLDSMNVTGKKLTPETRRNLAETYAQYLAFERPATKAGLENTPQFAEIMLWWRLRTLADLYLGNLQQQFNNPSPEELHAYYVNHLLAYQRINVSRILIPRTPGTTDVAKRAEEKAIEIANLARERVAKGEELELVQKDAYTALGLSSPPITSLGTHSRSSFPAEETDELFSLEPGKVSKVESEGASYVVYKIISKETLSEDSVKDEISRQIAQDKFNEAVRSAKESAKPEFNESYFGPAAVTPSLVHTGASGNPHP